jgi:hypothetical protein
MNVALSGQEIDDTEAQYLQDILLDKPGLARRRGPVQAETDFVALPRKASGLALTIDPAGNDRYAALTGNNSNGYLSVWSADKASVTDISWPHALPTDPAGASATRYRLHSSLPALGGGTFIGTASDYGAGGSLQALGLWRGGTKADYSTGTISFNRGSATVTGSGTSWLANVTPGMFLFANTDDAGAGTFTATYIGTVLSVVSDTVVTLEKVSPYSGSAGRTYSFTSIRGFLPRVAKGSITTATDSTTVSGGATKFSSQGLGTGTWNIYRASDMTWIGKVASVQSNTSLTLAANAAIAAADERYIALRGDWSSNEKSVDIQLATNKVGWLSGIYAERQWYANNGATFEGTYKLWFSDTSDPEAVDLSQDGDWIPVSSTSDVQEPIRAVVPTYNAMLVLKESESFAVYGTSPSNFSAKKLEDDGCLSTMSVQSYGGGALWAGRNGIYFYDGIQVQNMLAQKFGDVWKTSIRSFDPLRYRMWSMIARNHYFLFIEDLDPTISVVKGNTSSTPTYWCIAINLDSRAAVMMTNLRIRGAVTLPAAAGRGTLYLMNTSTVGKVCDGDQLFDAEGVDEFGADGGTAGPDFYFVSKKYNAGNDVQLKRFKQLAVHYLAQGGDIKIDAVLGLNNIGQTLTAVFPASVFVWDQLKAQLPNWSSVSAEYPAWDNLIEGVFIPKRVRFLKKDHHFSFRLWQSASTMPRIKMGPFAIAYKLMRPGRVA